MIQVNLFMAIPKKYHRYTYSYDEEHGQFALPLPSFENQDEYIMLFKSQHLNDTYDTLCFIFNFRMFKASRGRGVRVLWRGNFRLTINNDFTSMTVAACANSRERLIIEGRLAKGEKCILEVMWMDWDCGNYVKDLEQKVEVLQELLDRPGNAGAKYGYDTCAKLLQ